MNDIISYKYFKGNSMLVKIIVSAVLIMGLNTTTASAKGNTTDLTKIILKQESLSKNIIPAYKKNDSGTSVLAVITTLEAEQIKLKSKVKNPEVNNMLAYLLMCVEDLKTVVKKPYSSKNAQIVLDLSKSIEEGSQYMHKLL